jgi:hypothetical protein
MMGSLLFIATDHGLFRFERTHDSWHETGGELTGHQTTSVVVRGESVVVGTVNGVFRSADQGQTWWDGNEGLTERHIRWLAFHPEESGPVFAGTEPAAIFISHDEGRTWRERPEVARLRDENRWNLPYSPEAGCVRGFAFNGTRGYAAVEQGGLLRSDDRGESWDLVPGSTGDPGAVIPESYIHPDVHSVVVRSSATDQVFAPTGGGLYHSIDGGENWTRLYRCYCRAIWINPTEPGHLVFGPADGVDRNGRIEESIHNGDVWKPAMTGLEDVWPHHMVERFVQAEDELIAVLSNGELIAAPVGMGMETLAWRRILPPVQDVNAVASIST